MDFVRMHADEIRIDPERVRSLLRAQFPFWANLSIVPIDSQGTDHAIFRLGDRMSVRMPRIHWATEQVIKEAEWLPKLAPLLPLELPKPVALCEPGEGYPWHWAVHTWIEGAPVSLEGLEDEGAAAEDLARFLRALWNIDPLGGPTAPEDSRGAPLRNRDRAVRAAIRALRWELDAELATSIWERAVSAPPWQRPGAWFHGDFLPGNILIQKGRVKAVLDFGGLAVGDPACDLMIAWSMFSAAGRTVFRQAIGVDDATWLRGKGHALAQALIYIPYYRHSLPAGVGAAWRTIGEIMKEESGAGGSPGG